MTRHTLHIPQSPAEQAAALLSAVEQLDNPLADILAALDANTLLQLLNRVRPKDRVGMLQYLGVPSAKLSMRAADQCLSTLRIRKDAQHYAAGTISQPTRSALADAVHAYECHHNEQPLLDAVAAFSETRAELMLAAFAGPLASPGTTALLRLALQRFPMPAWPKDEVHNLISACTVLEDAWLPLMPGPAADQGLSSAGPQADAAINPAPPFPYEQGIHETPGTTEWNIRASELTGLLASASAATARVAEDLDRGYAPRADDLAPLSAVRDAALDLHRALAADPLTIAPQESRDIRALAAAAREAATAQAKHAHDREVLQRASALLGPVDNPHLQAVRDQAGALLAGAAPGSTRDLVRLLVELADATATDEDSAIDSIQGLLKDAPQDISSVATLILRGKVTAPTPGQAHRALSPVPEAVPQPSPPAAAAQDDQPEQKAAARTAGIPPVADTPPPSGPAVAPVPRSAPESEPAPADPPSEALESNVPASADIHHVVAEAGTDTPAPDSAAVPADVRAVAHLINDGHLALAAHAARATGRTSLEHALQTMQLAHCVRSETGPCATAVRERIDQETVQPTTTDHSERLLLLASALRAALLTADPNAGELINALTHGYADMPHLQRLCTTIGTASARGQLTAAGGLNVLDAVAEADAEVTRAATDAREHLAAPRHLHFPRAESIVRTWWDPEGLIGSLLMAAAQDQRTRADHVAHQLRKLTPTCLKKSLKEIDDRLRNGSAVLQGAARQRILQYAAESLDIVNAWLLATRTSASGPMLSSPLATLRDTVHAQTQDASTELHALADTTAGPLAAAVARAAHASIMTTVGLLGGATIPGSEPTPAYALNHDLVRCARLPLDKSLDPSRPVTLEDVEHALTRTWAEAAHEQAQAGNFAAARIAVEAVEGRSGEDDTSLRAEIELARGRALAAARTLIDDVSGRVATATRQGRLPEPGRSDLTARLQAAEAELASDDFSAVNRQIASVESQLPQLAAQAKADLTQRARDGINNAQGEVPNDVMTKITRLVDAGDLATAEDYLLTALAGEEPPTAVVEDDLERFFPAVPDQLPTGITTALIEAVAAGGSHAGLDFSHLRTRDRNTTIETLRAWTQLLKNWRTAKNNPHQLRGALRIAGIEYGSEQVTDHPYTPNRRWIELADVQFLGGSRLPAFGTEAGGRLRILLTTDVSDVTTLLAWAAQDTSPLPILVVLLGTLSATSRRELAAQSAKQDSKPLLCLDAAALAYLASKASSRFSTTERILAPFAATNPYQPDANEAVPREMFYGRQQELTDITAMSGAQLLYGGRQLGKSALLRAAARRFETTRGHVALYIPLPTTLGLGQATDELWDMIGRELDRRKITPAQPYRRNSSAYQRVTSAVTSWLDHDQGRRLLVLFDECDIFFDAESQASFQQTTRLRELMSTTNRRFKPVFAGLHQVQRFSGLPNQPLAGAHFGNPVVIGPLAPAPAFQLIQQPLEALGIRLPDTLIHRILAYCNYHPKLLQLAGQALVQTSLRARTTVHQSSGTPPWTIDNAALERVIGSQELTDRTRQTINLTLELDPRYKLIALIVALEAHAEGIDQRITTRALSTACLDWWPQGFTGQGPDEFRALLEEMTGLGILASDTHGWRLRSSNVLRLLGNPQAVEEALENHDRSKPLTKLTAAQARRPVCEGRISPLTEQQLARLTAPGNELRIVAGSPATTLADVIAALEDQHDRAPSKLEPIVSSTSPSDYRKLLSNGKSGPAHRVVVMDLSRFNNAETARASLQQALTVQPQSGATRTVVALADARNREHLELADEFDPSNTLVPLRRATPEGVSSWISDTEAMAAFAETQARNQLLDATGGWPLLLNAALLRARQGKRALPLCASIREDVASGALGTGLLDDLGLTESADSYELLSDLAAFDEALPWDDIVELLQESHDAPEKALARLRALDVLAQDEEQRFFFDPVVRSAWSHRKGR